MNDPTTAVQAVAPDIAWGRIIGLRNRLVHAYWLTDPDIIFQVATTQASPLARALGRLIETIE